MSILVYVSVLFLSTVNITCGYPVMSVYASRLFSQFCMVIVSIVYLEARIVCYFKTLAVGSLAIVKVYSPSICSTACVYVIVRGFIKIVLFQVCVHISNSHSGFYEVNLKHRVLGKLCFIMQY